MFTFVCSPLILLDIYNVMIIVIIVISKVFETTFRTGGEVWQRELRTLTFVNSGEWIKMVWKDTFLLRSSIGIS